MKSVSCTCVYNQSGKCKHVAALIYYVDNYESLSKTNFEQQWGKPTPKQFVKEKYSKGANFAEMYPPTPDLQVELSLPDLEELPSQCPLFIMLSAEKEATSQNVDSDNHSLVTFLEESAEKEERKKDCEVCVLNIHNFIDEYVVYHSEYVLNDTIKQFYDAQIVMSRESIINLCSETIDQAMSSKWEQARSIRFSASTTIHKIKIRKTKTVKTLLEELFFPKKISVPSIKYGKDNESVARKLYETMSNKQVKEVGVIVSKYQPWLCASSDGIVIEDGCIVGLVEIKCPSSCEKVPVVDVENKRCNVTYLEYVEDEIILQKSHVYYTQCQIQMYVCGLNKCDLFVYSPVENGSYIITVDRDELFIQEAVQKAEELYFSHFLPILVSKKNDENEKKKGFE